MLGACVNPEPPLPPCDDKESCEKAITLLFNSKFSEKKLIKAIEYATKACDLGGSESCIFLGKLHQDSYESYFQKELAKLAKRNIVLDYHKAKAIFSKSCSEGNSIGCVNLGILYAFGRGVMKDYTKAVGLYTQACNMNNRVGCYNLGLLYSESKGVRQDYLKARELYTKACNMGEAGACNNLGVFYTYGKSVRQDKAKAREFFGKACDMGNQKGCDNYRQ